MYSWFYPIAAILQPVLTFFFNLTQDWGLAIIVFTLFIKSALFFLNLRVARQQVKQAKLQPQLQELRKQSKDNPKQLAEANMQLYKEHGIKPFSTLAVVAAANADIYGDVWIVYSPWRCHDLYAGSMGCHVSACG